MVEVKEIDAPVALESVLCTEELNRRPSRAPDYETENRAWWLWPRQWLIRREPFFRPWPTRSSRFSTPTRPE